jgi:signal transduction histidine kinase
MKQGSLRERSFWTCFGILVLLAGGYAVALAVFLIHDDVLESPARETLAWHVAVACWAIALPAIWLIARLESRWIARHVQQPIARMIGQCEDIRAGRAVAELSYGGEDRELRSLAVAINEVLTHFDEKVAAQRQFAAAAAHELQTPLTAQSLVGQNALARKGSAAELCEAVRSMLEESKHMSRLIGSLLELARASAPKVSEEEPCTEPAPLALHDLALGCVDCLRILAEEQHQSIEVNARAVWVDADLTMIRQALLNVIHNAIEHCPAGTHIRVETARFSSRQGMIRVTDDGPGIPAEQQQRVFERFYRGGNGGRRGLGLGLAIANAILKSQHGAIHLRSEAGEGCCFTLTLPLHAEACLPAETTASLSDLEAESRAP